MILNYRNLTNITIDELVVYVRVRVRQKINILAQ